MKLVILGLVSASLVGIGTAEAHQGRSHYNAAAGSARAHAPAPVQSYGGDRYSYSRAQSYYSDTGWQPGTSAITQHGYGYGYGGAGHPPVVVAAAPYQGYAYGPAIHQVQRSQPFGYVVDGYGRYPWSRGQAVYSQGQAGYDQGQSCDPCQHYAQPRQVYHQAPVQYQAHYQAPAAVIHQAPVIYQAQPVYVTQPPIHVQAPPVYVQGPQVHVQAPAVHVAAPSVEVAPSQIIYDQGYFAAPAEVAPPPPPPPPSSTERPYRQERGERG